MSMEKIYYTKVFFLNAKVYSFHRTLSDVKYITYIHKHWCDSQAFPKMLLVLSKEKQKIHGFPLFFIFYFFWLSSQVFIKMEHMFKSPSNTGQHWFITCHPLPWSSNEDSDIHEVFIHWNKTKKYKLNI